MVYGWLGGSKVRGWSHPGVHGPVAADGCIWLRLRFGERNEVTGSRHLAGSCVRGAGSWTTRPCACRWPLTVSTTCRGSLSCGVSTPRSRAVSTCWLMAVALPYRTVLTETLFMDYFSPGTPSADNPLTRSNPLRTLDHTRPHYARYDCVPRRHPLVRNPY